MSEAVRECLGKALYQARTVGYFVVAWEDLPDHRRQDWCNVAESFLTSEEVGKSLKSICQLFAA